MLDCTLIYIHSKFTSIHDIITETVYNLFGQPTWKNLYLLEMFNLKELQGIIECRKNGQPFDQERHREIIKMLEYAAKSFDLIIPAHWR